MCAPHLPYIAHDHSQRMVSARKLPQPLDISVPFYDDHEQGPGNGAKVYTVAIKFERELDIGRLNEYVAAVPVSGRILPHVGFRQVYYWECQSLQLRSASTGICVKLGSPAEREPHGRARREGRTDTSFFHLSRSSA